jgi:hypothetical protein
MNSDIQIFFEEESPDKLFLTDNDYASVACRIEHSDSILTIGATNLNNKEYQKCFKFKDEFQINDIVEDIRLNFNVYVITEGYYDFYVKLMAKLSDYKLINISNTNYGYEKLPISGILIGPNITLMNNSIHQITYLENNISMNLVIPWVRISYSSHILIIVTIHLPEYNPQFPFPALSELNGFILELKEKYNGDIITIGDFNTIIRKKLQ